MTTLPNVIELRNITQTYKKEKDTVEVIKGLNLVIEDKPKQGQFITILGPSGCGKSTLLRYVCGLQKPTEGEVYLLGKLREAKDTVGMVFQQYSSYPWRTVIEIVALVLELQGVPKKERLERAYEKLKMVGLEQHYNKFAMYPNLSGGQLQRVAIARSLLANPQILLMDEPFGALDIKTRAQMQDSLLGIWNKLALTDEATTVVMVTHDISEAVYLSDDIYIMSKAPANFVEKIHIDLPLERNRDHKKSKYFQDMVGYIEDRMFQIIQ